jgi:hypothetical protein
MKTARDLCRPNTLIEKKLVKLTAIEALKNANKGFDSSVDSTVELGLGFCFQQRVYGVGIWLKDAGRGLWDRVIWQSGYRVSEGTISQSAGPEQSA